MKRSLSLCLILLSFLLIGCENEEEFEKPVSFFYLNAEIQYGTDNGVISAEIRESNNLSTEEIVSLYLAGPQSQSYRSPFPDGTALVSMQISADTIYITLNDRYADLSGLSLSLANTSIAQTLLELTTAEKIILTCESKPLGGSSRIEIMQEDLLLVDESVGTPSDPTIEPTVEQ